MLVVKKQIDFSKKKIGFWNGFRMSGFLTRRACPFSDIFELFLAFPGVWAFVLDWLQVSPGGCRWFHVPGSAKL